MFVGNLGAICLVLWRCASRSNAPRSVIDPPLLTVSNHSRSRRSILGAAAIVLMATLCLWLAASPENAHMIIGFTVFGLLATAGVIQVIVPSWSEL